MDQPLRIGISASFMHRDPTRALFKDKTLLYVEESLLHWVSSKGALATMLPTLPAGGAWTLENYVRQFDALLLQGGADVCPESYGESALHEDWRGDVIRDRYEISLVKEFRRQEKPILGICRGIQLLNVAFGGTLYQDLQTQHPQAIVHRNWDIYDQNFHSLRLEPKGKLAVWYPRATTTMVNSIHHQALKSLGEGLVVEARSIEDDVVEAVSSIQDAFVWGLQWHPEFHGGKAPDLLSGEPILNNFLEAAATRRSK